MVAMVIRIPATAIRMPVTAATSLAAVAVTGAMASALS